MSTIFAAPLASPARLTDKYCPTDPAEFIGLAKAKQVCSALARNPQRVYFDGAMRPVEEVAAALLEFGRSIDYVFRFLEFRLGIGQYAEESEQ